MSTLRGPHAFLPLQWTDKWTKRGRCYYCYLPRWLHPAAFWFPARKHGDRSPAVEVIGNPKIKPTARTGDGS